MRSSMWLPRGRWLFTYAVDTCTKPRMFLIRSASSLTFFVACTRHHTSHQTHVQLCDVLTSLLLDIYWRQTDAKADCPRGIQHAMEMQLQISLLWALASFQAYLLPYIRNIDMPQNSSEYPTHANTQTAAASSIPKKPLVVAY